MGSAADTAAGHVERALLATAAFVSALGNALLAAAAVNCPLGFAFLAAATRRRFMEYAFLAATTISFTLGSAIATAAGSLGGGKRTTVWRSWHEQSAFLGFYCCRAATSRRAGRVESAASRIFAVPTTECSSLEYVRRPLWRAVASSVTVWRKRFRSFMGAACFIAGF